MAGRHRPFRLAFAGCNPSFIVKFLVISQIADHPKRLCLGDQLLRLFSLHIADGFEFLSFEFIVIDKELLEVVYDLLGKVLHGFYLFKDVGTLGNGKEAVVADHLFPVVFGLFRFDAADDAAFDHHAGETVEFGYDDHVQGVAILSFGIGDKTEVIGKDHTGRKDFTHFKEMGFLIIVILLRTPFGSLDHNLNTGHSRLYEVIVKKSGQYLG